MITKRAIDWRAIGDTLITPEVLGAIIGGTGAPLITYLARRKKEMPAWRRVAELLGAGVLGAGAGAGIGYGGKQLMKIIDESPHAQHVLREAGAGAARGAVLGAAVGAIVGIPYIMLTQKKKAPETSQEKEKQKDQAE